MNWKDTLRQLKYEYLKRRAPDFFYQSGGYKMKLLPYDDSTSNGLTKCICDYIKFNGGDAQRVNSTGMLRKINSQMKWTHSGSRAGSADIHAVINGRAVHIEIKIGKDKQSPAQLKEQERITRAGGLYFIARSMTEFIIWYEQHFK